MKNLSILGVTGSIGETSLKICKYFKDEIKKLWIAG